MSKNKKCSVKDNKFVEPCDALLDATDNLFDSFTKARGITMWTITNLKTLKPARTLFGIRTKNYKNGLPFNYCPFCGERIDTPFYFGQ